ncbi:MAG: gamma-glutamylcyclotransferase family protein [Coriobacteriaceae bacterium]|nr:gamma-glutamylcyclotransferase family protein [Coriobacteriaceae bacterium]
MRLQLTRTVVNSNPAAAVNSAALAPAIATRSTATVNPADATASAVAPTPVAAGTHTPAGTGTAAIRAVAATDHVDCRALDAQVSAICAFRDEQPAATKEWVANIGAILDFQLEDGSFPVLIDPSMPADIRVLYLYNPSYACCQALCKARAALHGFEAIDKPRAAKAGAPYPIPADLADKIDLALERGLAFCCTRSLMGHGIEGFEQQLENTCDFIDANITFLRAWHRDLCPDFFNLIERIAQTCSNRLASASIFDEWGKSVAEQLVRIADAFDLPSSVPVFVYGTLMTGCRNARLISDQPYLGTAQLNGYNLFELGSYPGILASEDVAHRGSTVMGELRMVDFDTLLRLNELEGEGTLYKATRVNLTTPAGPQTALAYVYLHEVDPASEIPVILQPYSRYLELRQNLVWYVAYGSNIKYERLNYYIQGGTCPYNGKTYEACNNASAPLACEPCALPYGVYFGNESPAWHGFGVAFLDTSQPGFALGRAYLITREQLDHIHTWEGRGSNWYPAEVELSSIAGIPAVTFTNPEIRPWNYPAPDYEEVLMAGLEEAYPFMSEGERERYLWAIKERTDNYDDNFEVE